MRQKLKNALDLLDYIDDPKELRKIKKQIEQPGYNGGLNEKNHHLAELLKFAKEALKESIANNWHIRKFIKRKRNLHYLKKLVDNETEDDLNVFLGRLND